jgi:hypothetical protein
MSLARQGTSLARQGMSLARQGTSLARQGTSLARQGMSLARQGMSLARPGTSLARQGTSLVRQGRSLACQGTSLDRQGGSLARQGMSPAPGSGGDTASRPQYPRSRSGPSPSRTGKSLGANKKRRMSQMPGTFDSRQPRLQGRRFQRKSSFPANRIAQQLISCQDPFWFFHKKNYTPALSISKLPSRHSRSSSSAAQVFPLPMSEKEISPFSKRTEPAEWPECTRREPS